MRVKQLLEVSSQPAVIQGMKAVKVMKRTNDQLQEERSAQASGNTLLRSGVYVLTYPPYTLLHKGLNDVMCGPIRRNVWADLTL